MSAVLWIIGGVTLLLVLLVGWSICALAGNLDQQDEDELGVRRS